MPTVLNFHPQSTPPETVQISNAVGSANSVQFSFNVVPMVFRQIQPLTNIIHHTADMRLRRGRTGREITCSNPICCLTGSAATAADSPNPAEQRLLFGLDRSVGLSGQRRLRLNG
ncbi:hypothetical protein [Xenorhabdus doucetiae]|uniref:hypothetical protein n=1 Tax=Xenorhabdus doucetiae TaxID=351671 RepID=UPI0011E7B9FA|nr:hypothetical protein [Xenorhabdus doucetiae]